MGDHSEPVGVDLQRLAEILRLLLERDDDRPARWLSPDFGRQVAQARSAVAVIVSRHQLAARLARDLERPDAKPFDKAARRLAADATAVGLAIRWLEIELDLRLPTWPVIVRQPMLGLAPVPNRSDEAGFWFG